MQKQRNLFQMKELDKASEKDYSEMELMIYLFINR